MYTKLERGITEFDYMEDKTKRIIKIIGVGGGGGNAVTKMHNSSGVSGVTFLLCNTDQQALDRSQVAHKICIGPNVTRGLGAGNRPERARAAAEDSYEDIYGAITSDDTEMVFITAGMGGGTGTGAAPVIGKIARDAGKLTIGIVTIPFLFEGKNKIVQALHGVRELKKNVDAILIVNNQRLIEIYGDLPLDEAFATADATLSNAAKGISDMVNLVGLINLDFADVRTTLQDSGVAIISTGEGEGPGRLKQAIDNALRSPLLNNNAIERARRILISVYQSQDEEHKIKTSEMTYLEDFTSSLTTQFESIWGYSPNSDVQGDRVRVTILAAGFDYAVTERSIEGVKMVDPLEEYDRRTIEEELEKMVEQNYGTRHISGSGARINRPAILDISELDDDRILTIIEEVPSVRRDLSEIERLRQHRRASVSGAPSDTIHHAASETLQISDNSDSIVINF